MSWDKLSMADRANYIKLAVQNGVYDLSHIKAVFNQYAEEDSNVKYLSTRLQQEGKKRVNKFGKGGYKNNITVPDEGSDAYYITHEGVKHRFNTQQEAQQFVDENINSSDKGYHVATPEELERYTTSGVRRTAGFDPDSEGAVALADRNVAYQIADEHANMFSPSTISPSEYLKSAFPNGVPVVTPRQDNDPIRAQIFKGEYNGKKFTPTDDNIKHYLKLYDSDKHINKEYSSEEWMKGAAKNLGIGAAIYASPAIGKFAVKNLLVPELAAQAFDAASRWLTGTTPTEELYKYLKYKQGWGELPSGVVSGFANPGYLINPYMTGKYTGPLFQKLGAVPTSSQAMYDSMISGSIPAMLESSTIDNGIKSYINSNNNSNYLSAGIQSAKQKAMPFYRRNITRPIRQYNRNYSEIQNNAFNSVGIRNAGILEKHKDIIDYDLGFYNPIQRIKIPLSKDKGSEDIVKGHLHLGDQDIPYSFRKEFSDKEAKQYLYDISLISNDSNYSTIMDDYLYENILLGKYDGHKNLKDKLIQKLNQKNPMGQTSYGISRKYKKFRVQQDVNQDSRTIEELGLLNPALHEHVVKVEKVLEGDGLVGGSSIYGQLTNKAPHDLEIVTTQSRLQNVIEKLEGAEVGRTDLVTKVRSPKYGIGQDPIDVQVIQQAPNGNAQGTLAIEYFRLLHPDDYHKWLEGLSKTAAKDIAKGNNYWNTQWIESNAELPIKAEDLFNEIISSPKGELGTSIVNEQKVISDLLSSENDKHVKASLNLILNPKASDKVAKTLEDIAYREAKGSTASSMYPNLDYNDIEANKQLLRELKISPEYASNPEIMKNIIDRFHNVLSLSTRGVFPSKKLKPGETTPYMDALQYTSSFNNGNASGGGGNRLLFRSTPGVGSTWVGTTQTPLTFYPEKVKTAKDILEQVNRLKNLKTTLDSEGNNIYATLWGIEQPFSNTGKVMDSAAKKAQQEYIRRPDVDAPFFIGGDYGFSSGEPAIYMGQYTSDLPQIVHTVGDRGTQLSEWGGVGFPYALTEGTELTMQDVVNRVPYSTLKRIKKQVNKIQDDIFNTDARDKADKLIRKGSRRRRKILDETSAISAGVAGAGAVGALGAGFYYVHRNSDTSRISRHIDFLQQYNNTMTKEDKEWITEDAYSSKVDEYARKISKSIEQFDGKDWEDYTNWYLDNLAWLVTKYGRKKDNKKQ